MIYRASVIHAYLSCFLFVIIFKDMDSALTFDKWFIELEGLKEAITSHLDPNARELAVKVVKYYSTQSSLYYHVIINLIVHTPALDECDMSGVDDVEPVHLCTDCPIMDFPCVDGISTDHSRIGGGSLDLKVHSRTSYHIEVITTEIGVCRGPRALWLCWSPEGIQWLEVWWIPV